MSTVEEESVDTSHGKDTYDDEDEEENKDVEQDAKLQQAEHWKSVGNKHMAAMEYNKAYNAYSNALKICPLGPTSHVYLSNRAAALLSLKRYSAAILDSRRAIALAPTFGKGHARLGQSLYFLKDYAGAVDAYENALQFEPDNQITTIYLAKAKRKLERSEEKRKKKDNGESISDLVSVADSSVALSPTAFQSADHFETENDHAAAILTGRRNVNVSNRLQAVLENESDKNKSNTQRIVSATPSSKHFLSSEDLPYDEMGTTNIPSVVEDVHDNAENGQDDDHDDDDDDDGGEDPDFDEALRLQGRASEKLVKKQYRAAVDLYSAALFLVPDDLNLTPHLFVGRANALNGLRRHEGAFNDAKMALNRNPNLVEAHTVMARSLFYLQDYRAATQAFESALDCLDHGNSLSSLDNLYYEKSVELSKNQNVGSDVGDDDTSTAYSIRSIGTGKPVPKLKPPRFVPRLQMLSASPGIPSLPKQWLDKLPQSPTTLRVGPEREVTFVSERLGVKLNRGPDGVVRVLSVSDFSNGVPIARKGDIAVGDVVREVVGVDLRRPITNVMWGDTVALIKMAQRPIVFIVAVELSQPPAAALEEVTRVSKIKLKSPRVSSMTLKTLSETSSYYEDDYVIIQSDASLPSFANGSETVSDASLAMGKLESDFVARRVGHRNIMRQSSEESDTSLVTSPEHHVTATSETNDMCTESKEITSSHGDTLSELFNYVTVSNVDSLIDEAIAQATAVFSGTDVFLRSEDLSLTGQAAAVDSSVDRTIASHGGENDGDSAVREILFPSDCFCLGWSIEKWRASSVSRKVVHDGAVYRLMKGSEFWSEEQVLNRFLVLFSEPNVLVILRNPKNASEIENLLYQSSSWDESVPQHRIAIEHFYVAETLVDLQTCKLKLSPLTTPSSLLDDSRRKNFFELITPTETIPISVRFPPNDEVGDVSLLASVTSRWERLISELLFQTHEQDDRLKVHGWKHHLVLGSLHSYVLHNKRAPLERVLASAKDRNIVDKKDDDGFTALHYACLNRSHEAVATLVAARADCSVATLEDDKTPYHVSAELLDDKSLSILLSSSTHPDPNALDKNGRTPMCVAIMKGRNVCGFSDPELLDRCLTVLERWGGQMLIDDDRLQETKNGLSPVSVLPHPVHYVATEWRGADLAVILSHCNYRFHIDNASDEDSCAASIGSRFDYPLHACLIALRDRIARVKRGEKCPDFDEISSEPSLALTIRILLEHGFEPNERIEYVRKEGLVGQQMNQFIGFTPLQILAMAAIDMKNILQVDDGAQSSYQEIHFFILASSKLLLKNGARINIEVPPKVRPNRTPYHLASSVRLEDVPSIDRGVLKIDKNRDIMEAFGSEDAVKHAIQIWIDSQVVCAGDNSGLIESEPKQIFDCKEPGGCDSNSCAICWKSFNLISSWKKKTFCTVTRRYVCEECSSKFVEKDGKMFRISDGQYNLAKRDFRKKEQQKIEAENEKIRLKNARAENAKRSVERNKEDLFGTAILKVKDFFSDQVKDLSDLVKNKDEGKRPVSNHVARRGDVISSTKAGTLSNDAEGLRDALSKTRDAMNERGERLNTLSEKSASLNDASVEYLKLAKELRKKQESAGFFSW